MMSNEDWCPIDNHPGVFTALTKKIGVKGVQVEEVWCMDDAVIANLKPVHGLIFLYKSYKDEKLSKMPEIAGSLETIYFAKQIINNACATQALVNLLLNLVHDDYRIGEQLTELKEFSLSFDPKMKGMALTNSIHIRTAHNSLSPRQFFGYDIKTESVEDEERYNYVGYMPIDGRLYELDMMRDGPIDHGPLNPDNDWLNVVRPAIVERINSCRSARVDFNLMALITDQRMLLDRELIVLSNSMPMLNSVEFEEERNRLCLSMEFENVKLLRYRQEMARKRHSYVPLIIAELKNVARDELDQMCQQAKARADQINRIGRLYEECYAAA